MKKAITLLALLLCITIPASAANMSEWAKAEFEKATQKKKSKIFKYPAKIYAYCGSVHFAGFFYHWWNFIFYHAGRNA